MCWTTVAERMKAMKAERAQASQQISEKGALVAVEIAAAERQLQRVEAVRRSRFAPPATPTRRRNN